MSSSPKDTTEATEPPKSSDVDTQPWNDDKRRKFETLATAPPVNDRDTDEVAYRDCKQAWTDKRKKEGRGWF
ncbi:hypothetical protein FocTR4_00006141 [Fusarium oxysporum f. sp. cubense]|uniref:Uncharacterized protein n=1 Tax=Fusarium oxysporum f. sp. cubense TaxID=61366 RepID=A0A5C6TMS2_FUSOC|nr:hypothetical protein FocTR4_00006141 [Fusarium oxysporum f. sp. cubense]